MVTVRLIGRLGNQMFQYAMLYSYCKRNNYELSFKREWAGKDLFKNLNYGLPYIQQNRFFEDRIHEYNPNFFNNTDNIELIGFFQSEKYFENYRNDLQNFFHTEKIITDDNCCYIHLRGGDYRQISWALSKEWYYNAISYVKENYNIHNFKIITDDNQFAKEYFPEYENISKDMNHDYLILNSCKYSIISCSTFSWWACWLNDDNITIAPNYWTNNNKSNIFNPKDIKSKKFIYI